MGCIFRCSTLFPPSRYCQLQALMFWTPFLSTSQSVLICPFPSPPLLTYFPDIIRVFTRRGLSSLFSCENHPLAWLRKTGQTRAVRNPRQWRGEHKYQHTTIDTPPRTSPHYQVQLSTTKACNSRLFGEPQCRARIAHWLWYHTHLVSLFGIIL